MTDEYTVFSSYQNGSFALKNEVNSSAKRLNAAMYGGSSVPQRHNTLSDLYTDKKSDFLIKKSANLDRIINENHDVAMSILENQSRSEGKHFMVNSIRETSRGWEISSDRK